MTTSPYAVVTGSSRGLGAAFARALALRKRNLVLVARSKDKLEALAGELEATRAIHAVVLPCDLTSPQAARRLSDDLQARNLEIDMLVNNAGFGERGAFVDLPLERQLDMVRLNSQAVIELTYHLLFLIRHHRGCIVNVASAAGFQPIPYAAVYAATKSCLISFSMGLEQELRPSGVRVVTLCPGRIHADSGSNGRNRRRAVPGIYQSRDQVVQSALQALDRGGGLVVPGAINKFSVFIQRVIPRRTVAGIMSRLSRL